MRLSLVYFILFISAAMMMLSGCSPKSNDCGFVTNVYGQRISWKGHFPVTLAISKTVPAALRPAVYRAAATWDKALGRKVFNIIEESNDESVNPSRDRKNAIYFLSEWESDKKSEQGRTSVYWAGDEIQEADIRINGADFVYYDQNPQQLVRTQSSNNNPKAEGFNFEALVLHEMGHFLGLKHREGGGTVMATTLSAYSDRVGLAQSDQGAVQCEY